jgi:hypothetical protein
MDKVKTEAQVAAALSAGWAKKEGYWTHADHPDKKYKTVDELDKAESPKVEPEPEVKVEPKLEVAPKPEPVKHAYKAGAKAQWRRRE